MTIPLMANQCYFTYVVLMSCFERLKSPTNSTKTRSMDSSENTQHRNKDHCTYRAGSPA